MQQEQKQPFLEHLQELRGRLLVAVMIIFGGFFACFNFSEEIFSYLTLPMKADIRLLLSYPYVSIVPRPHAHELVFLGPAEAFWVHMKVAFVSSLVLCAPVIFWQVWRFVSPGLHSREKRMALPFIAVTSGLFLLGTAFCFIIVLPFAMNFLLNFKTANLTPMISVERYIDFCLKFILAFGAIFELPVVLVFLTRMGVVTPAWLSTNRKYAVLMAFIAAAVLTPTPDAFNQTLMAVPIIVLYEGGIIASRLFGGGGKKVSEDVDSAES